MGFNQDLMAAAAADLRAFVEAGVRELEHTVIEASSARLGAAPGAPVDTGELRGSVRITLGEPSAEEPQQRTVYPIVGAAEVDAALASFELGEVIWNRWIAEHAEIIEGGRRVGSHGRMIGSDQAPDGFLHLAIDEGLLRLDRWEYAG